MTIFNRHNMYLTVCMYILALFTRQKLLFCSRVRRLNYIKVCHNSKVFFNFQQWFIRSMVFWWCNKDPGPFTTIYYYS